MITKKKSQTRQGPGNFKQCRKKKKSRAPFPISGGGGGAIRGSNKKTGGGGGWVGHFF